mmetsp:Transcript_172657/g.553319  ORF Transcript_172657/g.553319 Transcript_172657/m.553319 type:complete len:253 (+) Transcript_172657:1024-1782(+)
MAVSAACERMSMLAAVVFPVVGGPTKATRWPSPSGRSDSAAARPLGSRRVTGRRRGIAGIAGMDSTLLPSPVCSNSGTERKLAQPPSAAGHFPAAKVPTSRTSSPFLGALPAANATRAPCLSYRITKPKPSGSSTAPPTATPPGTEIRRSPPDEDITLPVVLEVSGARSGASAASRSSKIDRMAKVVSEVAVEEDAALDAPRLAGRGQGNSSAAARTPQCRPPAHAGVDGPSAERAPRHAPRSAVRDMAAQH